MMINSLCYSGYHRNKQVMRIRVPKNALNPYTSVVTVVDSTVPLETGLKGYSLAKA